MSEWLRAETKANALGVDRNAKVIRGIILAEEGPFKSKGRGEFDQSSIREIVKLSRLSPNGLKSRFTHPTMSDDGLGKYLGRVKDVQKSFIMRESADGPKELMIARGDLHFAESAFKTPGGDLATYIMDLIEEDPGNAGMSLVVEPKKEQRLDSKGRPKLGADGEELPPIWRPVALHAVDVVDDGDATRSMLAAGLSIDGLPDEVLHKASELLRTQFSGKSREFVQQHLQDWMLRALDVYWPQDEPETFTDTRRARLLLRGKSA